MVLVVVTHVLYLALELFLPLRHPSQYVSSCCYLSLVIDPMYGQDSKTSVCMLAEVH